MTSGSGASPGRDSSYPWCGFQGGGGTPGPRPTREWHFRPSALLLAAGPSRSGAITISAGWRAGSRDGKGSPAGLDAPERRNPLFSPRRAPKRPSDGMPVEPRYHGRWIIFTFNMEIHEAKSIPSDPVRLQRASRAEPAYPSAPAAPASASGDQRL